MKVRLGDVCEIVSGTTPKSNCPEYWNGKLNWVTPAELNENVDVIYETQRKITQKAVIDSNLRSFPTGTILLTSRAPIGKVAIAGKEMYCNQGFKNLICSDLIYNKYLFYLLKHKTEYLNSLGRGATFKEISKSIVADIEINLPIKETQYKIVQIVDKIYKLISLRQQQLKKLDELVKSRFIEMFGDRLANNKKWNQKQLRECTIFYNGKAHESVVDENGNFILVTSKYIASDKKEYRKTNSSLFQLFKGDICMVMSDVPKGKALAKCVLIEKDHSYTLNQRICCFRNYKLQSVFFFYLLNRHEYFLSFDNGDSQTNLRKEEILSCPIILPPIALQNEFASLVEQTNKSKLEIQKSLDKLEILKKSLMQEYFS